MAILLEHHGNSLGMLWECSGNTLEGKHGSALGVPWDVGIACGNTPGVSLKKYSCSGNLWHGNAQGTAWEEHGKIRGIASE